MIYEYKCENCGEFEHKQSINDPALDHCPTCKLNNKPDVPPKRLISLSSFKLVGNCWAKDRYS